MHFCLICNDYPPGAHGGIGSVSQDLAEGLTENGHEVTVVGFYGGGPGRRSPRLGEPERANGVNVYRLAYNVSWCPGRFRPICERLFLKHWLTRLHRRSPLDLIEAPDYEGWLPFGGPAGVPVVARLHGSNVYFDSELKRTGSALEHKLEKRSLRKAGMRIGVSGYVLRKTNEYCGIEERREEMVPNSVDTSLFAPDENTPTERGLIVFVNSIIPKKGVEQLIDAANLVLPQCPYARLVLIGAERRGGEYREGLISRINPDVRSRVSFMGPLDRKTQVLQWLRKAEICCYPSHMEAFPVAPLEAMAVGKPVLFSTIGPGPELLEDGKSGLLCNPFSPEDIAEKLLRILGDLNLASELGANARSRAIQYFDKRDWIQKNIAAYDRFLNESRPQVHPLKDAVSSVAATVLSPVYSGIGSILCLHRVVPRSRLSQVGANRALEVTPEFLEDLIQFVSDQGYEILSLDDAMARIAGDGKSKKFVCFTFDDGYLDTLEVAYPVFKRRGVPFAVYLTTSFMEGRIAPWWYRLEQTLAAAKEVRLSWNGSELAFETVTRQQREAAFDQIATIVRNMEQSEIEDLLRRIAASASLDGANAANAPMMTWEQVRELAKDRIVTIGAHTVSHYTLGRLDPESAAYEIGESRKIIESQIGKGVVHFSYPFGGRNAVGPREFAIARGLGFKSMTTTRSGNLFRAHRDHLDCLPRLTVSGNYPTLACVRRMLNGMESAMKNPFRRLVTD